VVGVSGGAEEALRELGTLGDGSGPRIANRDSYACALGSAGWSGLVPGARYLFTVEAARRLVARRDQVVRRTRWVPGLSLAATWQTLLNSVTFGHNVAIGAVGRGRPTPAPRRWQRRIDYLASIVLAVPALLIAIPIELAGGLFRRGAVVQLRFELL
jgi:ABC-type Fe3+ transport system permease subunit